MRLVRITSIEEFKDYQHDWSSLLEEKQNTNPFIEFPWIYEWWKHIGQEKSVEIIAVEDNSRFIAFLPLVIQKKWFGDCYTFVAFGDANYMDIIALNHQLEIVIEFIFDQIMSEKKNVVFHFHGLLESSKTSAFLEAYLQIRNSNYSIHRVITPYIDLQKIKLSEYIDKRQKLHRLSRREKRLRASGQIEMLQSDDSEIDSIFMIHNKQWKKKNDTSGFTNKKKKDLFQSLININTGPLKTKIDSLYLNDKMIAFSYGFVCRGRYLSYMLGYDDNFEVFSPGRILEKETILKYKHANLEKFDLSIGYEPYKFDWNTHIDFTRTIVFASNSTVAKIRRSILSRKELFKGNVKKNYRLVLFKRNSLGKLSYLMKNLFNKNEMSGVYKEIVSFIKKVKDFLYFNKKYLIYKIDRNSLGELPDANEFLEVTLNDALLEINEDNHIKEINKKIYGGYVGYYPKGKLTFNNIIWTNEKVLRIEEIFYIENFRKRSVYVDSWAVGDLKKVCSLVKKNTNGKDLYVAIKHNAKKRIMELESAGFIFHKYVKKKVFLGNEKTITKGVT